MAGRVWNLQVPVPGGHSIHLKAEERLPTLCSVALPRFWAVLFAGPRFPGASSAVSRSALPSFLLIPAISLLIYAGHAIKLNLYHSARLALGYTLNFADYLRANFEPYLFLSLLALALYPDLRSIVLTGTPFAPKPPAKTPARPSVPVRIGYRRNVTPDIPADDLARIAPILEALDRSFRPLAAALTAGEEPAVIFDPAEEPAE